MKLLKKSNPILSTFSPHILSCYTHPICISFRSNEGGDDDPLKKKKKLLKKKMIMSTTSQPPAKQLPAGNVVRKKKLKSSSNKPPKNEPREDGKRGKKVVHEQGREIIGNWP